MLKHGEVNPLNLHGLRRLDWCPPHFTRVVMPGTPSEKIITDWLYENLSGRFYVGITDTDNTPSATREKFVRQTVVAFEVASEASYFSLFIPQLFPEKNF